MHILSLFPEISILLFCSLPGAIISDNSCQPGTYQPSTGAASTEACLDCPTGTYQNWSGATLCNICPAGSYCPTGTVIFIACPAGTYQPNNGAVSIAACLRCPIGTYQEWSGGSLCRVCPTGYTCIDGITPIPLPNVGK